MCGIFGIITSPLTTISWFEIQKISEALLRFSQSRGSEASGIALYSEEKTHILKTPGNASILLQSQEWKNTIKMLSATRSYAREIVELGQARLATNGSAVANRNNQPISGVFSLCVHNGIVLNEQNLWNRHSKLSKKLEVDTEIIVSLYESYRAMLYTPSTAIKRVFSQISGETNVAIFDEKERTIVLGTNTGSIFFARTHDAFVFASERYILEKIIQKAGCHIFPNDVIIRQIQANHGAAISMSLLKMQEFTLYRKFREGKDTSTAKKIIQPPREKKFVHIYVPILQTKNFHTYTIGPTNTLGSLHSHRPNTTAIKRIRRCTKCIMPETMPMITFNSKGICNFCQTYVKQSPRGMKALTSYIDSLNIHTDYPNCIIPLSGGRDSSYGLYYAKKVLGLHPIAYTYDWGMVTDIARRNQSRMCAALGIEHIWVSADIQKKRENIRKNVEAWLNKPDLGMVTLLMAGDKQAEYFAEKLKKKTGIKLIIYCRGNQLEDERFKFGYYGIFDGTPRGVIHNLSLPGKLKMLNYYIRRFAENNAYINSSLIDTALGYASSYIMHHDFVYLWHYIRWDEQKILKILQKQFGWETPTDTIATWRIDDGTPAFYNYIYYKIQGFTEHDGLRSNQIREGVLSRDHALFLVEQENKPRYESLKWYFDTIGIDGDRALSVIDAIPTLY